MDLALVTGYGPRKLTDLEVNGIVYAMVIGGLETTQYAIEEEAQLLCEHPEFFRKLKGDRDLIRQFVEESMRLRSPTQGLSTRLTSQDEVFQGNGDSEFVPTLSAAWGLGNFHAIGDVGGRVPVDGDAETTQFSWNVHLDYAVLPFLVPFVEAGGLHYTSAGTGKFRVVTKGGKLPLAAIQASTGSFDAVDVGNIGGVSMDGASVVIFTAGLRVPITKHLMLGGSYDFPVSDRKDIFNQRATLNATLEF